MQILSTKKTNQTQPNEKNFSLRVSLDLEVNPIYHC